MIRYSVLFGERNVLQVESYTMTKEKTAKLTKGKLRPISLSPHTNYGSDRLPYRATSKYLSYSFLKYV